MVRLITVPMVVMSILGVLVGGIVYAVNHKLILQDLFFWLKIQGTIQENERMAKGERRK
jgi:hypothetical protein